MAKLIPFHNTYKATGVPDADAQDVVLIHGWGLHAIVFDDIVPALLERFRVTVVDLPGMGQSPLPNDDYTLDFLADQVLAIMPEQAHLLGWSLGGLVALAMAEKAPQRVESVVTVATSPRFTAKLYSSAQHHCGGEVWHVIWCLYKGTPGWMYPWDQFRDVLVPSVARARGGSTSGSHLHKPLYHQHTASHHSAKN